MTDFVSAGPAPEANGTEEPILEPSLLIVDSHHHLWPARTHGHDYLLKEFLADLHCGHRVNASVYVECGAHYRTEGPTQLMCVGEVEFAERIARECAALPAAPRVCAAIVGHADLTLGAAVQEVLEAEQAAAPGRLRGIRQSVAWDQDPDLVYAVLATRRGMMDEAAFRSGFARLDRLGLGFDAWLYHPQLEELTRLAEAFPGTRIVLDHLGTPLARGRYALDRQAAFAAWRCDLARLSRCANVYLKLGGLAMSLCGVDWTRRPEEPLSARIAAATRDYYRTAIELFSPARCMFESNFPVERASVGYRELWNAFKRLAAEYSEAERHAMFAGTAIEVYRLEGVARPAAGD